MVEKIMKKRNRMGSLFRRAVAISRVIVPFRKGFRRHNKTAATAYSTKSVIVVDHRSSSILLLGKQDNNSSSILLQNNNNVSQPLVHVGDYNDVYDLTSSSTSPTSLYDGDGYDGDDDYDDDLLEIQNTNFLQLLAVEVAANKSSSSIASSSDSLQHIPETPDDINDDNDSDDDTDNDYDLDFDLDFDLDDGLWNTDTTIIQSSPTTPPPPPVQFACVPNNFNHDDALLLLQDNDDNNDNKEVKSKGDHHQPFT